VGGVFFPYHFPTPSPTHRMLQVVVSAEDEVVFERAKSAQVFSQNGIRLGSKLLLEQELSQAVSRLLEPPIIFGAAFDAAGFDAVGA
jgi:hypothetical protein